MEGIYACQGWIYVVQKNLGKNIWAQSQGKRGSEGLYAQMEELDNEAELAKNKSIEVDTERRLILLVLKI